MGSGASLNFNLIHHFNSDNSDTLRIENRMFEGGSFTLGSFLFLFPVQLARLFQLQVTKPTLLRLSGYVMQLKSGVTGSRMGRLVNIPLRPPIF